MPFAAIGSKIKPVGIGRRGIINLKSAAISCNRYVFPLRIRNIALACPPKIKFTTVAYRHIGINLNIAIIVFSGYFRCNRGWSVNKGCGGSGKHKANYRKGYPPPPYP